MTNKQNPILDRFNELADDLKSLELEKKKIDRMIMMVERNMDYLIETNPDTFDTPSDVRTGEAWRQVDQQSREIQELKAQCQEHLRELSCFQSLQDSSWRLD